MTDKELEGLGAQAFNMAKLDLERKRFNFLVASYHIGEGLYRMKRVEETVISLLGENWLNCGRAKDVGFAILRKATDTLPPDAIVIATITNKFTVTPKMDDLPVERQREILRGSHKDHHRAAADGYMRICDALAATVQTPERVCIYMQECTGRGKPLGAPETSWFDQKGFGGRMKMFGEEEPRGVLEDK